MSKFIKISDKCLFIIIYSIWAFAICLHRNNFFYILYFSAELLIILFADKMLNDHFATHKTAFSVFIVFLFNKHFLELLNLTYGSYNHMLLTVFGIAIFIAGVLCSTKESNMVYCFLSAIALCFLNSQLSLCYSAYLVPILLYQIASNSKSKNNHKKPKTVQTQKSIYILYLLFVFVCIVVSLYLSIKNMSYNNISFFNVLISHYNIPASILCIIYFVCTLLKSIPKNKLLLTVGSFVQLGTIIFLIATLNYTALSIMLILTAFSLCYQYLQTDSAFETLKEHYSKYKVWFLCTGLLLLS